MKEASEDYWNSGLQKVFLICLCHNEKDKYRFGKSYAQPVSEIT